MFAVTVVATASASVLSVSDSTFAFSVGHFFTNNHNVNKLGMLAIAPPKSVTIKSLSIV
jgi:hypothetical protein